MKTLAMAITICVAVAASVRAEDENEKLYIEYEHAGLTKVTVTAHGPLERAARPRLQFSWHTERRPFEANRPQPLPQSMEAYDGHSANVWLTKAERDRFMAWVEESGVLHIRGPFPKPEAETYGAAFKSSLTVQLGDREELFAWTGDSKVPDALNEAVSKLIAMSREIAARVSAREGAPSVSAVVIQADAAAKCERVLRVLSICRRCRLADVTLSTAPTGKAPDEIGNVAPEIEMPPVPPEGAPALEAPGERE